MPARSLRTCVGCRKQAAPAALVRLVAEGESVRPAPRRGRRGRGASLHPDPACLKAALASGALQRAFRKALAAPSPEEFANLLSLHHQG